MKIVFNLKFIEVVIETIILKNAFSSLNITK